MKTSAMLALILVPAALCADPSVERVVVRQQWPWSTDVKVEYSLSGVDAGNPVDISVRAFNGSVELPSANLEAAITGERFGITSPVGAFTIDPVAAFGTEQVALGNFKVQLSLSASSANMNDILYKIVDLDPPYAVTDVRRRDFYNGKYQDFVTSYQDIDSTFSTSLDDVFIWRGVTNDIYKTNKMVLRRIPAAGKSYMMQTNNSAVNGGAGIEVSFEKDFYIGVFEVTQTQWHKFASRISYETNALYSATRPASYLNMQMDTSYTLRATQSTSLANHDVKGGFFKAFQDRTGLLADLPTEAMWEYACRAGTTTALYSGKAYSWDEAAKLSPMYRHISNRNCDLSKRTNAVGSYKPNAWGLYDMIGNVWEWCLDNYVAAGSLPGGTDPIVTSPQYYHVIRGAGVAKDAANNNAFWRQSAYYGYFGDFDGGFRVCLYLDNNDNGTK